MEQIVEFRQVRTFEQKLNASFAFIRENFQPLMKSLAIIGGPVIFLLGLADLYMSSYVLDTIGSGEGAFSVFTNLRGYVFWNGLIGIFTNIFVDGVALQYILLYREKGAGNFSVRDVWDGLKGKTGSIFILGFVLNICINIGTLLLVVPGIYLYVALSIALPVFFFENSQGSGVAYRCTDLVKGKWWQTFGLLLTVGVIFLVFDLVLSLPTILMETLPAYLTGDDSGGFSGTGPAGMVFMMLEFTGRHLASVIIVITMVFHYFALVEEKEHRGLFDKISAIGSSPVPGAAAHMENY